MGHTYIKTATLAGLLSAACVASAMPPIPGVIDAPQPDGTTIQIELRGDEHFSWAVTPDGTPLLRDTKGFWTAASHDEVTAAARKARRAHKAPATQVDNSFPTKGKCRLLMLLVNFSDTRTTYSQQDFSNYMNLENYLGIGSFRDYYLENSYGALDIETTVTPWITVSGRKTDYNTDNAPNLVYEALEQAAQTIDLRQFDNDGDGILDGLAVIHQGTGQESSGDLTDIWSHSDILRGRTVGGVEIRRYTIEPEVLRGGISTIGVMCHEFGHNLGAPDFYDSDYAGSGGYYPGTGVWDLMGSGAWNGLNGNRPAGINMWQKIQCGWVTPVILDSDRDVTAMPGSTLSPTAYRMNTTVPGDYFIIENRQRQGNFDAALPGSGVLIYHANDNLIADNVQTNTLNSTFPQSLYTVCAAATTDPTSSPDSYGDPAEAPFPGAEGRYTAFNDRTRPSTRSISGRQSYCGLSDIAIAADGNASFRFVKEDAPAAPQNLSASVMKGVVTLSWTMPSDAQWTKFNIYRNGVHIASSTTLGYVDESPTGSRLTYEVDAEHTSGQISPYSSVTLRVPTNKVVAISPEVEGESVALRWSLNRVLTRMDDSGSDSYQIVEHQCNEIEYAHRFTADDLTAYKGYKIRRIRFMAYQPSSDAEYTIRVWQAEPGSDNPTLVSERAVKEFGSAIWNSILLTSTVEITGRKDIWIGIKIKTKQGVAQILADNGALVDDYGNLVKIDGGDWHPDNKSKGNFYLECELNEAADDAVVPVGPYSSFDPEYDLYYPIGFVVYRDGEAIGTTASRYFRDDSAGNAAHTYAVASLYKGDSESIPLEIKVGTDGVSEIATDSPAPAIIITCNGIIADGYHGTLGVYDVTGRTIYFSNGYCGDEIILPQGIYIVRTAGTAAKICIK